jgi:uncharacterized protein (TIRG00374 family)
MRKKHIILGYLVGAICLYFAFRGISFRQFGETLVQARLSWILPALFIYSIEYGIRATRWSLLIKPVQAIPARRIFWPMMIGYLANNVLPLRMGEFVRAHICGMKFNISRTAALGSIFLERICDTLSFLSTFLLASWFYPFPRYMEKGALVLGAVCIVALAVLIGLRGHEPKFHNLLDWSPLPKSWTGQIKHLATQFIQSTSGITQPRYVVEAMALSLIVWTIEGSYLFLMAQAFGVSIHYGQAFFLLFALGLSVTLPQAPGYVGTFEFFGVTALAVLGIPKSQGLPLILAVHGSQFILIGILGAIGLWKEGLSLHNLTSTKGQVDSTV